MNYQWSSVVQFLSTLSPQTALISKIIIGTPLSYYTLTLFKKLVNIYFIINIIHIYIILSEIFYYLIISKLFC